MKTDSIKIEDLRLESEDIFNRKVGLPINPEQIWTDSKFFPEDISSCEKTFKTTIDINENESFNVYSIFSSNINSTDCDIIDFYEKVPVYLIHGTDNCFNNENYLNDIILPIYGKNYNYIIYVDDIEIPYGRGLPSIDQEAGFLRFDDKEFFSFIKDKKVTISFYKYVGRKGMANSESLPFSDELTHFKNAEHPENTASFIIKGNGFNKYILPDGKQGFYEKLDENENVIVTQENIESIINRNLHINGGTW